KMVKVPTTHFHVDKHVNLFYHVCVLFSEYFPDEYALGILNNQRYRQRHGHLRTWSLHREFERLQQYSFYTWDFIGKSLSDSESLELVKERLETTSDVIIDTWLKILAECLPSYNSIWLETEEKLVGYRRKFEKQWNRIYTSILTKMSNMTKFPWRIEAINVYLVDCVWGAQSWVDDIVLPLIPIPDPDLDVAKKLLTHEIAHIQMPNNLLKAKLRSYGVDLGIAHTIVDLVAYFSVRDHFKDPERHGMKPNPNYYIEAQRLYPIFEYYSMNPEKYETFDELLEHAAAAVKRPNEQ
ncbi:MAG: hypothetical protein ACE5IF_01175, partial [Candidatus Bathyarchaeia archaeon]